ncbi:MAG: response regulator transcription factor, partial [Chloroflexi bacterium]|nr:response regulator transcription factor [Chloroflexota bacterium]
RILVADDHPVVREGLVSMLSGDEGFEVVGQAGSGEEAVEKAKELAPDVVLIDIRMPGISGIEATGRIKAERPTTAVIVMTMYDSEMYVVDAIKAGAAGYLVKDSSRELVCYSIKAVINGGTLVRGGLLRQAVQVLFGTSRQQKVELEQCISGHFTAREMEVLRLVAQGLTNAQIAKQLFLAEATVKKYVQSVIGKLGVSDRTQAAIVAVKKGLVD